MHGDSKRCHHGDDFDQAAMQDEGKHGRDDGKDGRLPVERQRIERIDPEPAEVALFNLAEQDVQREPDRQVENDTDHGGGDCRQRAG